MKSQAYIEKYRELSTRPTKIGVVTAMLFFVGFLWLDFNLNPNGFVQILMLKAITVSVVIGLMLILSRFNLFSSLLQPFLIFTYFAAFGCIFLMISMAQEKETLLTFYPLILPVFMMWFVSFYFGTLVGPVLVFLLTITGYWLGTTYLLEESSEYKGIHMAFLVTTSFSATIYSYFIQKVRTRFIINDQQLSEQKESLSANLFRVNEQNQLLSTKQKSMEAQLSKLKSQIPEQLAGEIMNILEHSVLEEKVPLENQVFNTRQVQRLMELGLSKDQIILLSGFFLNLTFAEIQENLFPHLSIRSLENMASKIRKVLNLPRGADLLKVLERL